MRISYLHALLISGALSAGVDSALDGIEPEAAAPGARALERQTAQRILRDNAAAGGEQEDRGGAFSSHIPPISHENGVGNPALLKSLEKLKVFSQTAERYRPISAEHVVGEEDLKLVQAKSDRSFATRASSSNSPLTVAKMVEELVKLDPVEAIILVEIATEIEETSKAANLVALPLFTELMTKYKDLPVRLSKLYELRNGHRIWEADYRLVYRAIGRYGRIAFLYSSMHPKH